MAAPRRLIDIPFEEDRLSELEAIARSRTAPASWVERARILLAYRADPSCYAVGAAIGVTHQTVLRCLDRAVRFGTVCKILDRHQVRPHKIRYYLERRDEAFEARMADVLCVYREVAILQEDEAASPKVAIISYDEKPGIQAISNTAPDLPPQPGSHASFARDHEYKRHGTLSLLAGIDLLTGKVHACVEDRHRSREFVGFLKRLDDVYSEDTAIKLILDNHSAHVSKETKAWLATQPEGRFTLVFTPKHGSWLNLVEGFFSKMARSMLRHIRVASKAELKARILAYLDDINREPVVHAWTYKIGEAA